MLKAGFWIFELKVKKVGGAKIGGKPLACHHVTVLSVFRPLIGQVSVSQASDWPMAGDPGV